MEPGSGRRTSVKTLTLLAMVILGTIPAALMLLQGLHCAHEAVLRSQKRELYLLLSQQQVRVEEWLLACEADLRILAGAPSVRILADAGAGQPDSQHQEFLDTYQREKPDFAGVAVFNADWQPVASTTEQRHPFEETTDPKLINSLKTADGVVWSRAHHPHDGRSVGLHIGCPIIGTDGRPIGYLLAAVFLDDILPRLSGNSQVETSMKVLFADIDEKRVLSVGDPKVRLSELPAASEKLFAAESGGLVQYEDYRGERVLGMWLRLPVKPWALVAEIDRGEALALLTFLLHRSVMTLVVVVVVILIAAAFGARILAGPWKRMVAACRQISAGNEGLRLDGFSTAEPDEVALSFNTMLDRLRDTRQELIQKSALAAVGELSARVVHEMRNPLNTIQINVEAIRGLVHDEKHAELLQLTDRQTKRLQSMLDELLKYGAPLELSRTDENLLDLVEGVAQDCRPTAEERNVDLVITGSLANGNIRVDREQLGRALRNLADNAIMLVDIGGTVRIALAQREGMVEIAVSDDGPGVPEGMRKEIFEPFFTTRDDGTGLGLAIVRKIVELHGGTVHVSDAAELKGACFTAVLPRMEASRL